MNIINGKFNTEELSRIYGIDTYMGRIKDLRIYNNKTCFDIQKFINDNGELVGYAVVELGINGVTNDAALEDIAFWKGTPEELEEYLKKVLTAQDYSDHIENFYYEAILYPELICQNLEKLGFKELQRQR